MIPKFTTPQWRLLVDLGKAGDSGEILNENYRPAVKLVSLGYASKRSLIYGEAKFVITDAGRAALSKAT